MFGRKKKSPGILYQIVGSSGISDGDTVQPKERITKSFTILNKAPLNSKEKGRVVKVTQSHGESMKSQVLFLWPVPGKFVTVSFIFFLLFFIIIIILLKHKERYLFVFFLLP